MPSINIQYNIKVCLSVLRIFLNDPNFEDQKI